jgi:hypothetical protein
MLKTTHRQSWEAFIDKKYLLRRVNLSHPFLIVEPKKKRRRSRDTSNLYVAMMDTLDSWADYPRRGYSVIFGTTNSTILAYAGFTYYCFVENGAKIGVASGKDLWFSWPHLRIRPGRIHGIDSFCDLIERRIPTAYFGVFEKMLPILDDDRYTVDNIYELYKVLNTHLTKEAIGTMFESLQSTDAHNSDVWVLEFLNDVIKHEGWRDYEAYFNECLDPKKNSFQLVTIDGIDNSEGHEAWSDANVILINEHEIDEISYHMTKGPDD